MTQQSSSRRWRHGSRSARLFQIIGSALGVAGGLPGGVAEAQASKESSLDKDIVVVGQRPRTLVDKVKPDDSISPATIRAFGVDSIGEVIARIHARYGNEDFIIVVNGRRVGALESINALPPEALAKIDILPSSGAGILGLPPGERILNIQLRPKFKTTTLEGSGSETTEGGGGVVSIATRYAHIHENNRSNLAVIYRRTGGLHQSDRQYGTTQQGNDVRPASSDDLTLIPQGDALTATVGQAGTLGLATFDLSLEGGLSRVQSVSNLNRQHSQNRYIRAGASANGSLKQYAWSLTANAGSNRTFTRNIFNGIINDVFRSPLTVSMSNNVNITGEVSGPVITGPAGVLTFSASPSFAAFTTKSRQGSSLGFPNAYSYHSIGLRNNFQIPITNAGSLIGGIVATLGSDYNQTSNIGSSLSYQYGVEWNPVGPLTLSISRNVQPTLPSTSQLSAPIIYQYSETFFDDVSQTTAPISLVTGGTTQLDTSITYNDNLRVNANFRHFTFSVSYESQSTINPLFSFQYPSALFQSLKPELFIRSSNGALISYDSRPFTGTSEVAGRISWNLHISGLVKHGSVTAELRPDSGSIGWDLGVNHDLILHDRVQIDTSSEVIDVIDHPLNLGIARTPRHRISGQASINGAYFGTSLFITWTSGTTGNIDVNDGNPAKIASLTQLSGEIFVDIGSRNTQLDNPSKFRAKLSVDNAFNIRPRLIGAHDGNAYGIASSPLGRTITINLRKVF